MVLLLLAQPALAGEREDDRPGPAMAERAPAVPAQDPAAILSGLARAAATSCRAVGWPGSWIIGPGMAAPRMPAYRTVATEHGVGEDNDKDHSRMDRFLSCLTQTLRWVGGYSDDRYDPGGKTMKGIIIRRACEWASTGYWHRRVAWRGLSRLRTEQPHRSEGRADRSRRSAGDEGQSQYRDDRGLHKRPGRTQPGQRHVANGSSGPISTLGMGTYGTYKAPNTRRADPTASWLAVR
jgi:Glycosyl hydrolase 108